MTQTSPSPAGSGGKPKPSESQPLAQEQPKTEEQSSRSSLSRPLSSPPEQTTTKFEKPFRSTPNPEGSSGGDPQKQKSRRKDRIAAAVALGVCMVPVVVSTASYYFASHWFEKVTKQADTKGHNHLVSILLIGSTGTALVAGALAALAASRASSSGAMTAGTAQALEASQEMAKREQSLTESIYRIHQSLKQEDVLKASVEEARRIISAQRVLIYSLNEQSQGVVIAESVASGLPKAMGARIDDPCFSTHYLEKYQNGRIQAVEDIYTSNLSPCYLKQLEAFAVRASLVVPIIDRGKLLGLLIAHQCSEPRAWKELEINSFTEIATQAGLALNNAKLLHDYERLQKQVETDSQWKKLLANAASQIHASLKKEDILKAAVEQARSAIAADRVLIYSLEQHSRGKVIAESVASDWPKALGTVLEDPCFNSYYLEKYKNGRIRVIEDIYSANLTPCHLGQLEPLAVKAGLIVPILNQDRVLGLLIAHQCSGPRSWKQSEIDIFNQIATQAGLAADKAELLSDSVRLQKQAETENHWNELFTDAAWNIRASLNEQEVLKAAVEQARGAIAADRVLIYSLDRESQGVVIAESVAPNWPKSMGARIDDPCFRAHYLERYQNGRVQAINDIYAANLTPCYLSELEPFAVKASLVVPILNQGKLLGLLIAHQCSGPRAWQEFETKCFAQIAKHIGFAIDDARLWHKLSQLSQNFRSCSEEREALQGQFSTLMTDSEIVLEIFAEDFGAVQETMVEAVKKVRHFSQSYQRISQAMNYISHLAEQLNDKAMNATIEAGRMKDVEQGPLVSLAEMVRSLTYQLSTATAEVEPLISQIETEANELLTDIEDKTREELNETDSIEQVRQKLNQIAAVNARMSALMQRGEANFPQ